MLYSHHLAPSVAQERFFLFLSLFPYLAFSYLPLFYLFLFLFRLLALYPPFIGDFEGRHEIVHWTAYVHCWYQTPFMGPFPVPAATIPACC